MRVLLTRAREDAEGTAARLKAAGHDVLLAPLIEIVPTNAALPDEPFDAILATSRHALDGVSLPAALGGTAWLVVGERLADALRARDLGEAEIVATDVASLLAAIDETYPEPFRCLYLAGTVRKPDLERGLAQRGHDVRVVETYQARPVATLDPAAVLAIREGRVDVALHYSRRSAGLFVEKGLAVSLDAELGKIRHIAISADAAAPLEAQCWPVEIAAAPDEAGMLAVFARL